MSWVFPDDMDVDTPLYIYKTSVDKKGHSRVLQTRVPPDWDAQVHKVLGLFRQFNIGYESLAEFMRDALIQRTKFWINYAEEHGLDYLEEELKMLNALIIPAPEVPWEERKSRSEEFVKNWEGQLKDLLLMEAHEEMHQLAKKIKTVMPSLFSWDRKRAQGLLDRIDSALGLD